MPHSGGLLLAFALLVGCGQAQVAVWHDDDATILNALSPGNVSVSTGLQLLQAFADGVGDVALTSEPRLRSFAALLAACLGSACAAAGAGCCKPWHCRAAAQSVRCC